MNGEQTSGGKLEQPQAPMAGAAGDPRQRPGQPQLGQAARLARAAYWVALGLTAVVLSTRPVVLGLRPVAPTLHAPAFQSAALQVAASELASAAVPEQPAKLERRFFQSSPAAPSVHASTMALLPGGDLVAAWFGGSREGAKDVAIYASNWDAAAGQWETPRILSDRAQSSEELGRYVKKLGNPVLHCDADGRLWLYYVTVSVGGWSGGSISVKHSDDAGRTWSDARRLIMAPFLNTSNLVRSPPIALADGGVLLPTYHEFLYQFGELLHLDAAGRVVDKYRMNSGGDSLQPTLVPRSPSELLALHRRGGKSAPRVLMNRSLDAGQTWSPIEMLDLANPNAAVAAVRSHSGDILMVFNPSESGREQLALARSADGVDWQLLHLFEDGESGQEFSYPSLIRGEAGTYHLSYTWDRERICHVVFNDAWLETKR